MYFPPLPKLTRELALRIVAREYARLRPGEEIPDVVGLAVRGYRKTSMGDPTRNDVGIVDDLLAWISLDGFSAVNANTDPSRLGWNAAIGKPFCMLQPGIWDFYPGAHRGRKPAYRQADDAAVAKRLGIRNEGKFLVKRMWGHNDSRNYDEWGHQQIDIHPMTISSTSSWACLTIPADKSDIWCATGQAEMRKHGQKVFPVVLIEGPIN